MREFHQRSRTRRVILTVIGALLAALAVIVYSTYRRDIIAARTRVSSGSQVVHTACGSIEYADIGSGPPVLLVHGAGGGFDQGLEFGRLLIDGGFRAIAMSRFGYLRTPLPAEASPIAQADAHACLLDALKLQRAAVIGVSAGAPSAMQFCLRHPDRCAALVLVVPLAFAPDSANQPQPKPSAPMQLVINTILKSDFLFWITLKVARDRLIETILATPLTDSRNAARDEQERLFETLRNLLPISARQRGLANDGVIASSLGRYELERFTSPTLAISTENDLFGTFESARYTAEHIRGARFIGYPDGGHLWVGRNKQLWSDVMKFLGSQQTRSSISQ